MTRYPGGYESYRSLRAEAEAQAEMPKIAVVSPSSPKQADATGGGPKPLTFAERKELAGLLDEITALEAAAEQLQTRLADPALYAGDPAEAQRIRIEHDRVTGDLTQRMARWEELESRRDVKRG